MHFSIADCLKTLGISDLNIFRSITEQVKNTNKPVVIEITNTNLKHPFYMRIPSSDVPTYQQIFINRDYHFDVNRMPTTIIDAGANIGLASIYFTNKYPSAKIIAIEPDSDNFKMLKMNTQFYSNISIIQAAVWNDDHQINLVDPGLGEWGYMTHEPSNSHVAKNQVQGLTIDTIMRMHHMEHVDILKMDIEGAEREVFYDASSWIEKVDVIIIELHERMKAGVNRSFYNGTNGFDAEWQKGENIFLTRNKSCLVT